METGDQIEPEIYLRLELYGNTGSGKSHCGISTIEVLKKDEKIAWIVLPREVKKIPLVLQNFKQYKSRILLFYYSKVKIGNEIRKEPLDSIAKIEAVVDWIVTNYKKEKIKGVIFDNISHFYEMCINEGRENMIAYYVEKGKDRIQLLPRDYGKWVYPAYVRILSKLYDASLHLILIARAKDRGEQTEDGSGWKKLMGIEPRHQKDTGYDFADIIIELDDRDLGNVRSTGTIVASKYNLKKDKTTKRINTSINDVTIKNIIKIIDWDKENKKQVSKSKSINILKKLKEQSK